MTSNKQGTEKCVGCQAKMPSGSAHAPDYDSGLGGQEIAKGFLIVGEDWWLERHEYSAIS